MSNDQDLLRVLAAVNPLPEARAAALGTSERDALLRRIYEGHQRRPRRMPSRRLLAVGISLAIAASAIPAAALSGRLGSLFDFSNRGTPDAPEAQRLNQLRVADRLGLQSGSTMRLAERSGLLFYTVRGKDQQQCFGISSGPNAKSELTTLMCLSADAFPSPSRPVLDFSPVMGRDGSTQTYFPRLMGFAADGVAEVGVLDLNGRIHTTPVDDNVYFAENVADIPAQAQVALDSEGEVVWRREVPKFDKLKTERQR